MRLEDKESTALRELAAAREHNTELESRLKRLQCDTSAQIASLTEQGFRAQCDSSSRRQGLDDLQAKLERAKDRLRDQKAQIEDLTDREATARKQAEAAEQRAATLEAELRRLQLQSARTTTAVPAIASSSVRSTSNPKYVADKVVHELPSLLSNRWPHLSKDFAEQQAINGKVVRRVSRGIEVALKEMDSEISDKFELPEVIEKCLTRIRRLLKEEDPEEAEALKWWFERNSAWLVILAEEIIGRMWHRE